MQATFHLLRNAVEAAGLREPSERWVSLEAQIDDADSTCAILISDSGAGVPDEIKSRLFQPFVTSNPGRLGLGLSKARTLVQKAKGTVVHHPGLPTLFSIRLPLLATSANSNNRIENDAGLV